MKRVIVYGSRDFGAIVQNIIVDCGYIFSGFIDDLYEGEYVLGSYEQVLTTHPPDQYEIAIAIGYNHLAARKQIYKKLKDNGYKITSLIHPSSIISNSAIVNEGTIIMTGAIIDMRVTIGEICVIWPGVVVNHDCCIGSNAFLCPNSTICGFSKIEESSFIGAGSVVVDHSIVPGESFVKAGSIFNNT